MICTWAPITLLLEQDDVVMSSCCFLRLGFVHWKCVVKLIFYHLQSVMDLPVGSIDLVPMFFMVGFCPFEVCGQINLLPPAVCHGFTCGVQ